jgi:alkanesulfonate monooxygenase
MFWGEPLAETQVRMDAVRAATPSGRSPAFSVSFRPILGTTEAEAWDKAHDYLERVVAHRGEAPQRAPAAGSQRLLDLAVRQEVHDERLWMAIAAATGAGGNSSALVGTAEQVAQSLLRYYDLGVTSFLIRGFEPLQDATAFGKALIPLVREQVAQRERAGRAAD